MGERNTGILYLTQTSFFCAVVGARSCSRVNYGCLSTIAGAPSHHKHAYLARRRRLPSTSRPLRPSEDKQIANRLEKKRDSGSREFLPGVARVFWVPRAFFTLGLPSLSYALPHKRLEPPHACRRLSRRDKNKKSRHQHKPGDSITKRTVFLTPIRSRLIPTHKRSRLLQHINCNTLYYR